MAVVKITFDAASVSSKMDADINHSIPHQPHVSLCILKNTLSSLPVYPFPPSSNSNSIANIKHFLASLTPQKITLHIDVQD